MYMETHTLFNGSPFGYGLCPLISRSDPISISVKDTGRQGGSGLGLIVSINRDDGTIYFSALTN